MGTIVGRSWSEGKDPMRVELKNVCYVPNGETNLLSVSQLRKEQNILYRSDGLLFLPNGKSFLLGTQNCHDVLYMEILSGASEDKLEELS